AAILAQVARLLEEGDVLGERDRHRALADATDVLVAILPAVASLGHDVGEDEASLLAEDFLRDLGARFHPDAIVGALRRTGQTNGGAPSDARRATSGASAGRMSRSSSCAGGRHTRSATS